MWAQEQLLQDLQRTGTGTVVSPSADWEVPPQDLEASVCAVELRVAVLIAQGLRPLDLPILPAVTPRPSRAFSRLPHTDYSCSGNYHQHSLKFWDFSFISLNLAATPVLEMRKWAAWGWLLPQDHKTLEAGELNHGLAHHASPGCSPRCLWTPKDTAHPGPDSTVFPEPSHTPPLPPSQPSPSPAHLSCSTTVSTVPRVSQFQRKRSSCLCNLVFVSRADALTAPFVPLGFPISAPSI